MNKYLFLNITSIDHVLILFSTFFLLFDTHILLGGVWILDRFAFITNVLHFNVCIVHLRYWETMPHHKK